MKCDAPFFRISIISMIYLDVKYFSAVCLSICYNMGYKKLPVKTALTRVSVLSVQHNLKFKCVKMPVSETYFKIFSSWFSYVQHFVTRNKFTLFKSWKLETLTLLTVKENLYTNLLRTIISSLVNKSYHYTVILFLCYVFSLGSKGFIFPLLC